MFIYHRVNKVIASKSEVAAFNSKWPCSELRDTRAYWFQFDASGDLVDTDCPHEDDGAAASAMADDCRKVIMEGEVPEWAGQAYIDIMGRTFKVDVFGTDEAANAYMANHNAGVIEVSSTGVVFVADMNDTGE